MTEHSNVALLRKIYARDRDTYFRMVTPAYICFKSGCIAEHRENPLDIAAVDAFWS